MDPDSNHATPHSSVRVLHIKLYLLLEHQSSTDATMPQCRLGYMAAKYAGLIKNRVPLPWPVILPMVVHHSHSDCAESTSYQDLFDEEVLDIPGVGEAEPNFQFFLDDISKASDEELLIRAPTPEEQIVPVTLRVLRDGRSEERLRESFARGGVEIHKIWGRSHARLQLHLVFSYLVGRGLTLQILEETIRYASAPEKATMTTRAEHWELKGETRGEA